MLVTTEFCRCALVSTGLQRVQHPRSQFITVWLSQAENTESLAQSERPHLIPEQKQKL